MDTSQETGSSILLINYQQFLKLLLFLKLQQFISIGIGKKNRSMMRKSNKNHLGL